MSFVPEATFQGLADDAVIEMVACLDWDSDHVDSSFPDSCLAHFSVHPTWAGLVDQPLTTVKIVMREVTLMRVTTMVNSLSVA